MAMQQLQGSGQMSNHVDDPTELDLVYNDLWNAKARIEALENENRELRKRLGENDDDSARKTRA